ncbi:MAG: glutaredoxin family protein [Gammaproteobacteria bacterium]
MSKTFTVYSRRGCQACEDMIAELEFSPELKGIALEVVDVDADAELAQKYGWHVPVLLLNGSEVCRHTLDMEKLHVSLAQQG